MVNPNLDELARGHAVYARSLQTAFRHKLTAEDCADVVQDAFLDAGASVTCESLERPQLEAWLRKAMRHRALDLIKARDGQGAVKRPRAANVDDLDDRRGELADGRARFASAIAEGISGGDDAAVVRHALAQLPPDDRQLLELRHRDGLSVAQCAEQFGLTLKSFERRHTAAVKRLRELVVEGLSHDTCTAARLLIDRSQQSRLGLISIARRDAHLAGCLRCRAYDRRRRGLIAVLPLPLVTCVRRLGSEALRLAPGSAPAATAPATPGVLGAPAIKLAALMCTGVAAASACGAIALPLRNGDPAPQRASRHDRPAPAFVRAARATKAIKATSTSPHQAKPRSKFPYRAQGLVPYAGASRAELKPPGSELPSTVAGSNAASTRTRLSATTASTDSSPGFERAPLPATTSTTADSSSGEFAPHP